MSRESKRRKALWASQDGQWMQYGSIAIGTIGFCALMISVASSNMFGFFHSPAGEAIFWIALGWVANTFGWARYRDKELRLRQGRLDEMAALLDESQEEERRRIELFLAKQPSGLTMAVGGWVMVLLWLLWSVCDSWLLGWDHPACELVRMALFGMTVGWGLCYATWSGHMQKEMLNPPPEALADEPGGGA